MPVDTKNESFRRRSSTLNQT